MTRIEKKTALKTEFRSDGANRITEIVRDDLPSKANRITSLLRLPPIRKAAAPRLFY